MSVSGAVVDQAERVARAAHEGQLDKAGRPYAEHPGRVAARVAGDAAAEAVAWLHDVVEDTPVSLATLAVTFPAQVVSAVEAITRRPGEAPDCYYARVRANPLALTVKVADLDDNTDPSRLAVLDAATRDRLRVKYAHARLVLMEGV